MFILDLQYLHGWLVLHTLSFSVLYPSVKASCLVYSKRLRDMLFVFLGAVHFYSRCLVGSHPWEGD